MPSALVLAGSALAVFAALVTFFGRTEGATLQLFPVGVVLALAALVVGIRGTLRGRGAARAASAAAAALAAVLLGVAVLGVVWALWLFGIFGNAWGS